MLQIKLDTSDLNRVTDQLHLLTERQLQFAVSGALNATIKATTNALRSDLSRTSGGPIQGGATRWTLGAIYQRRANTSRLEVETGIRQDTPRAAGRYLLPMIRGGMPRIKGIDLKVAGDRGLAPPALRNEAKGHVIRPAAGTRVNAQGNITRGRFIATVGRIGQPGSRIFIAPAKKKSETLAVFQRMTRGDRAIKPLFFISKPSRRRSTFNLTGDLRQSVDRVFPGEIRTAILAELARAGFR